MSDFIQTDLLNLIRDIVHVAMTKKTRVDMFCA